MSLSNTLAVVICVHNEEQRLAKCLDHLLFADELIVVLDKCTDNSKEIALTYLKKFKTGKILEGVFELEGNRRNAGIEAAVSDWVLEVDADEVVSTALAAEIKTVISTATDDWFLVPVDNYIGERLVRYGWGASFGVSAVARLFRKNVKTWGLQRVHPKIDFKGKKGSQLKLPLEHYVDKNIYEMIERLNRYTSKKALDLIENPSPRETLRHNILRFFGRFYKCYLKKKGYKEGKWGFLIALMAGLYPLLSYLKATLENNQD